MTGASHVATDGNSSVSKRQRMSGLEVEVQTTTMMDSCALVVIKFKVNYEQIKHLGPGKAIKSDAFSACSHMWRIDLYPHGMNEKIDIGNEYLTIFLEHLSKFGTRSIKAIFEVLLIDKDGEPVLISSRWEWDPSLQKSFGNIGMLKYNSQSVLVNNYVKDGEISFMCTITLLENSSIGVPPSNLGEHMGTLLDSRDGTDVSFIINGETFNAHRSVLASRSPVFKAELLGTMAEATMSSITLHEIAPATFKLMLQFIYTDVLPGDEELGNSLTETLQYLLAAADRYALDRLKLLCAQKLWDIVSVDTVATNIVCAEIYSCPELKHKCIDFFAEEKNFMKAALTDGFVKLVQQFPFIIAEVRDRIGARNGAKHNVEHCSGSQP